MATLPEFDLTAAHKYFSADCFNQAWDLIDQKARTAEEERLMVALNQASIYHWLQRGDCTNQNLSVGYWQASRIQALLGNAAEAVRHAQASLDYSTGLPPFYAGYAHEALARAAVLAGNSAEAAAHLARAHELAAAVDDAGEREMLVSDLKTI